MNLNQQAPVARIKSDGKFLYVHSVFPTIQGEGVFTGRKAVFVRLAGCNLQCPHCDTIYTGPKTSQIGLPNLVHLVKQKAEINNSNLVVITGGEPLRQNISPFIRVLIINGFYPQIETNGVLDFQDRVFLEDYYINNQFHVCVSPKTHKVSPVWDLADSAKYVVNHETIDWDRLWPSSVLGLDLIPTRPPEGWEGAIFINPEDNQDPEINRRNLNAARDLVSRLGPEVRIGTQLHKTMGIP